MDWSSIRPLSVFEEEIKERERRISRRINALFLGIFLTFAPLIVVGILLENIFLAVLPFFVFALFDLYMMQQPESVEVYRDRVVFKTRFSSWETHGYRLVAKFSTYMLPEVVQRCGFGWRLDLYSTNATCNTAYGKARVFSTPRCSDVWIVVEAGGRLHVTCCEDRDREICLRL